VAAKDAVDGGGGQLQDRADAGGAELTVTAQLHDLGLHAGGDAAWMGVGNRWPILQASHAVVLPTTPPAVGAGPRDAHLVGDLGDRPAGMDALAQQQSSRWGQAGVSVGHEGPPEGREPSDSPKPRSEVPPCVNNPHAQYS
jgi:hypothetical protein